MGILFLVLGFFSLTAGFLLYRKSVMVRRWPTTEGKIVERRVEPSGQAAAVGPPAFRFQAVVRYEYSVGGQSYSGGNIFPTIHLGTQSQAEGLLKKLATEVTVFYNPQHPEEAYLFSERSWVPVVAFVFGVACVLGSLIALAGKL